MTETEVHDTVAVRAENLFKVFGRRSHEAVDALKRGESRDSVAALGTAAVIDASFEVKRGEIFVVMGLSGSGKSTLIRMLNGLLETTSGRVTINGKQTTGVPPKELRRVRRDDVSMVFQHFALLPHRTVLDNVAYGLEIKGMPRPQRLELANRTVSLVGLDGWADKFPHELSGGMQQRVGIARALTADTDVLLMDEAFSALDPLIRREMQEQLVELQAQLGKTIVFITHDLNEAMFLGDRIAVMRDGRIVQIGTPEDILTDPANDYVAQFVQDVDRARVLTASGVMEPAKSVVTSSAGPRAALRTMRDLQTSATFVVGRNRVLQGVVRDRQVLKQVRAGERTLAPLTGDECPTVTGDVALSELYELAVSSDLPIAVVDDQQRLLGVIPRVTLLSALGNISTGTDEITIIEPPATVPISLITETLAETASDAAAADAAVADEGGSPEADASDESTATKGEAL